MKTTTAGPATIPLHGGPARPDCLVRFTVAFVAPSPGPWALSWALLSDDQARVTPGAAYSTVLGCWLVASATHEGTGERLDVSLVTR